MIKGIYTAAAAMVTQMAQQDVISNNLANLNTTGYKRDLALFRGRNEKSIFRLSPAVPAYAAPAAIGKMGTLTFDAELDEVSTSYSQGDLKGTDTQTDLAIRGKGFFVVQTDGGEALTRNGAFEIEPSRRLVDHYGNPVLGESGEFYLPPGSGKFYVGDDGTVSVAGQVVGKLRIENVGDPMKQLQKRGNTYYYVVDGAAFASRGFSVHQGFLEMSTASPISEMVNMISALRTYEASQKVMNTMDETLGRSVNDIGRVV